MGVLADYSPPAGISAEIQNFLGESKG